MTSSESCLGPWVLQTFQVHVHSIEVDSRTRSGGFGAYTTRSRSTLAHTVRVTVHSTHFIVFTIYPTHEPARTEILRSHNPRIYIIFGSTERWRILRDPSKLARPARPLV
ncbi:hypothetical protein HYDPIDRAFT_108400 [Hydnomerulius pinastri MD-312]|nr:hypothetical protein HYDPIDRAFT_108400 [Hydnomerulius pinastri MD-312]